MDDWTEIKLDNLYPKDCRDIKRAVDIEQQTRGVYVFAIAVALESDLNLSVQISTREGRSLCHEVYDQVRDMYHVFGVDFFEIGYIPVNYVVCIQGVQNWDVDIPLPPAVIRRYMGAKHRKSFDLWKVSYPEENYHIDYLQVLAVY